MPEKASINRLILCVDEHDCRPDGTRGYSNPSSIYRLRSLIAKGSCHDSAGCSITQTVRYHKAAGDGPGLVEKFRNSSLISKTEEQVKTLTLEVCHLLNSPQDELFLYGCGQGAYVVRAVAGVLHHMGLPTTSTVTKFAELYNAALDLYRARCDGDNKNGPVLQHFLKRYTTAAPQIKLVGLFDSVKPAGEGNVFDTAFVSSISTVRHAMALNESSASRQLYPVEFPKYIFDATGSLLQAWFAGTHQDLEGGTQQDGLSLYPLQWMILESMKAGIVIEPTSASDNSLALTFPQFAGSVPKLGNSERIEWQTLYLNGIQISMFDLQTVHSPNKSDGNSPHDVRLSEHESLYKVPRKVFDSKGRLIGWSDKVAMGCIVHPSVFCLWDRFSRLQEHSRFRAIKTQLAGFREQCMTNTNSLPPWLEGMQLQASGVKAFRILVCGKTGVGKSTLINKVFGVEMTEESQTYSQGVHDINQAFESSSHPGLLIHDSRGWQAGSETELDLIAKFLRHRAFQKDPTEALHVIWFCVDSDVSRIEEADKRTFATIAKFSHHVPVFVIGTKKDKLIAMRKMEFLEQHMQETGDYKEASRLANLEAERLAQEQFSKLREQLSYIEHYKADGYVCLSKDDDPGIKDLLSQTIGMIADERVRLFCVAAQVVDVEQKINSAITETLRLSTHAIRTAMVPLPFSGTISTPTVSRILVEHILQCFGFPKAAPAEIESIMSRVVLGNLKSFMAVSIMEFVAVTCGATAVAVTTMGAGAVIAAVGCFLHAPPTARMLLKCACDMILILERSFRYGGKYVSVKQIEDGAKYYTTATINLEGENMLLQKYVHLQIDEMIPLRNLSVGWNFSKIRGSFERIVFENRFGRQPGSEHRSGSSMPVGVVELRGDDLYRAELLGDTTPRIELPAAAAMLPPELEDTSQQPSVPELEGDLGPPMKNAPTTARGSSRLSGWRSSTRSSSAGGAELRDLRSERGFSLSHTISTGSTTEYRSTSTSDSRHGSDSGLYPTYSGNSEKKPSIGKKISTRLGFGRSKGGSGKPVED